MIDRAAERLTKLLLMLSSDRDGEVVAAVRAIDRTLKDAGADWHDFAARLLVSAKARSSHRATRARRTETNTDGNWHEMREFCLRHSVLLRSRELEFVTGLGGWRGDLTEKQLAWLSAIHEGLRRHAA
jgi:hypothetical protein